MVQCAELVLLLLFEIVFVNEHAAFLATCVCYSVCDSLQENCGQALAWVRGLAQQSKKFTFLSIHHCRDNWHEDAYGRSLAARSQVTSVVLALLASRHAMSY